jgi:hypothetical protein
LTPGKGFGVRSSCSITLDDHPWTDIDTDPYLADRTYDPDSQGTYWGKFIARNRYYEGREMVVYTGYLDEFGQYQAENFISRKYFIDTISGPDKNGKVQIKGKDVLKFADSDKAQWPTQSEATLDADITAGDGTFTVDDPSGGILAEFNNADNGAAGRVYLRIDDEIMEATSVSLVSGDQYTITATRASMPSRYQASTNVADAHSEDSTVQYCFEFDNTPINEVVETLLADGAGIDSAFLPTTDWQNVINFGLNSYLFTTLITEPTGVKDLIEELTQHSIFIWWNERDQEVQMRSIIQQEVDSGPYSDTDNIVADSVTVMRNDKERASQVWLVYGHRNPTFEMDKFNYFDSVKITADVALEGANAYDQKKVLKVWSRWLTVNQSAIASEITNRLNGEYKETKSMVNITLAAKDDAVWTGDVITASTRQIQSISGELVQGTYRVLEASEVLKPGSVSYKYKLASIGNPSTAGANTGLIGPEELNDYDVESEANKDTYAFIAANDRGDGSPGFGTAPNYDPPYFIV